MNKVWIYILVSVSVFSLQSCSLTKFGLPLVKRKNRTADTTGRIVLGPMPLLYPAPDTVIDGTDTTGAAAKMLAQVRPLWEKRRDFTTFIGKSKVRFETPEDEKEFSAVIRMQKDTAIWIDITFMGVIHTARLLITQDSCFMINYLQKEVIKLPLTEVARILPTKVDFNSLQNLILGQPLRGGELASAADLTNTWLLNTDDGSYEQQISYYKTDSTLSANLVNTKGSDALQALITCLKYESISGAPFSMFRNVTLRNNAQKYLLDIELLSADFNLPVELPFNIPKNYTIK